MNLAGERKAQSGQMNWLINYVGDVGGPLAVICVILLGCQIRNILKRIHKLEEAQITVTSTLTSIKEDVAYIRGHVDGEHESTR